MMNQSYSFSGRSGRPNDRDYAPYRRPCGRGMLPDRGVYPGGFGGTHRQGGISQGMPRQGTAPQGGCGCRQHGGAPADAKGASLPVGQRNVSEERGGCGCGRHEHRDRSGAPLMDQIRAVDFALYETVLYLDVYPDSCDALETYHKLCAQSKALHREYEKAFGPLTAFGNESTTSWDWMRKPCPWEYDAD